MLNNNPDVTAFYDVIYSGGQMPSTIRQGLTDFIRNTFADEVYPVYHSYDPETYTQDYLNAIKGILTGQDASDNFNDEDMAPLIEDKKGGCE